MKSKWTMEVKNDYVLAKNEDKNEMYVMFRGSQTFNDWLSNAYIGSLQPKLRGYKDRASDNERDHAGFTKTYYGVKDNLIDLIEKRSSNKTKVVVLGQS